MPSAKLLIGSAAATAALGVRVARVLHTRWRLLPEADRKRTQELADELERTALDSRGVLDREEAERRLRAISETFAAALIETAEADPELEPDEVRLLREDLRRELERIATADIKASRTTSETKSPPG
jgi:hypothetical protein